MRLSARPDDPDFIGEENRGRYSVTLNGREVKDVVIADDIVGEVIVMMRNDAGGFDVDYQGGEVRTHAARGLVRIIDKRGVA